jgi:hypothetical protein
LVYLDLAVCSSGKTILAFYEMSKIFHLKHIIKYFSFDERLLTAAQNKPPTPRLQSAGYWNAAQQSPPRSARVSAAAGCHAAFHK